jgi:glyoxylase-like metal-dependent hydrolase (beta-lactamase superfamily II)
MAFSRATSLLLYQRTHAFEENFMQKLTRRHFLQALGAAGAASALSFAPSFGRFAARAQASPMLGRVFQFARGGVTFHTYVAPDASTQVTSHIIETDNSLVIIDAQLIQGFAAEVKAYADGLGKPIDRLIISHQHPDHFLGANVFENTPAVTTPSIAEATQVYVDGGGVAGLIPLLGEANLPAEPRVPEGGLEAGDLTIDGVAFALEVVTDAEAPEHLIVRVPDAGVVIVQDLIYAGAHFFPGQNRANWIDILAGLRERVSTEDVMLVGHGLPSGRGELDNAITYLTAANALVEGGASADEVIAGLTAQFPAYGGTGLLSFWGLFIQG